LPEKPAYHAERLRTILDQYPVDDELRQRLLDEVRLLETPSDQEILPPNIPVDPESLRQTIENMAEAETNPVNVKRLRQMAEGVPPGHPGIDYHDGLETEVGHEAKRPPSGVSFQKAAGIEMALQAQAD
jgi:hypothetical protein